MVKTHNVEGQTELPIMGSVRNQDRERRIAKLKEDFPKPKSRIEAMQFFRDLEKDKNNTYSIVAYLRYRKDHDQLRVVLKSTDTDESDVKFEKVAQLFLDDKSEYDRLYVKTAGEAYDVWFKYESEKN